MMKNILGKLFSQKSKESAKEAIMQTNDNPNVNKDEESIEEVLGDLSIVLNREHLYGRSLAIKELLKNDYKIMENESANPFKELINYTLLFFATQSFKDQDPIQLIKIYFPIMSENIITHVTRLSPQIMIKKMISSTPQNYVLDEQKGYEEFVNFVCVVFQNSNLDKENRNSTIRKQFKIMGNDIISLLDNRI
jgi:hypothetical protein